MSEAYTSELEKQVQELKLLLKQRNDKIVELGGKIIELEGQSASLRERIKDHEIQAKQSEEDAEILRDLRYVRVFLSAYRTNLNSPALP